ncbi:hypothetical protein SSX86_007801 [Deinandra increscens subsp. villosa]|uniref:Jacalin-type lectin domain-containing protein n=1 Tax=Deinandra increscens subsp. villosa TaxID=3103831 RepID=A0AAP0DIR4_9ASTR
MADNILPLHSLVYETLSGSSVDLDGCITHGPWGGLEGYNWFYLPKGVIQKMKITVRHYTVVDSIEFQTKCSNVEAQSSSFGEGGRIVDQISIDHNHEYLMSISGTYGYYSPGSPVIVTSICFTTNLKRYGPYGDDSGTVFSHDVEGEAVVGFHGRASDYLNAIGVYVMPKSGPSSTYEGKIIPDELCSSFTMMTISRDAGPWGAAGGKSWDDGVFSMIKQIRVHVGMLNVIYALQFEYQKRNGDSVLSQIHGGTEGLKIQLVNLDDKNEYLTGISGCYGPVKGYDGLDAIVSISFHTNKRTHGPYGEEKGAGYVHFCSTPFAGKIVGLHGKSNGFLSAIGVHVEYF